MKLWLRIILGIFAIPALFFVAGWIYFAAISETLVSWDTPLSLGEALATDFGSNVGLPPSASEIYAFHRNEGSQQNLVYIRFTASPEDIEKYIQQEFDRHRRIFPNDQVVRSAISSASFHDLPRFSRPKWWHPQKISTGTCIRINSGLGPQFWTDTASNTLYYYDFS